MGLLSIFGDFGAGQAVSQSFSQNKLQVESSNENNNQAQAAAKAKGAENARALQSASNSAIQGNLVNDSETSQIAAVTTDICDFNILPIRQASIQAAGAWQATGANQINVQTPNPNLQDNLDAAVNVSTAIPTVSAPITTYPNPGQPFRVAIAGGDSLPFGGSTASNQNAVTPSLPQLPSITPQGLSNFNSVPSLNNGTNTVFPSMPTFNNNSVQFGALPKPRNSAQSLLDRLKANKTLRNAAQTASAFAASGQITRSHSIGQDGRVLLIDSNGDLADPSNPSATPGYNAATNTAPGISSVSVYSGNVKVPNLLIPGPVPGSGQTTPTPRTRSSVTGSIQFATTSNGKSTAQRGNQSQLQNKSALGTLGSFNNTIFSLIGIA